MAGYHVVGNLFYQSGEFDLRYSRLGGTSSVYVGLMQPTRFMGEKG